MSSRAVGRTLAASMALVLFSLPVAGCEILSLGPGAADWARVRASFIGEPFSDTDFDPLMMHRRHFDDGWYRVILQDPVNDTKTIYRTRLFEEFEVLVADWLPDEPTGGEHTFQDAVVLEDGTFVLYQNDGRGGTSVWTGEDLLSVTERGTVLEEQDSGAYYNRGDDRIHIYTEDRDHRISNGSRKLSHWTTPASDLLRATQLQDAIDLTDAEWKTGDPEVIRVESYFYIFMDRANQHPSYHIAVARSSDLAEWKIVEPNLTPNVRGGDLDLVERDGGFDAMTEYSGLDEAGVGHWRIAFER